MLEQIERILGLYESKEISRREAVAAIGTLALAVAAPGVASGQEGSSPTFKARSLNHLALRVTDVARSRDFYREHLGLEVLREDDGVNCFMGCGEHFVALFRGDRPGMDHFCFTIDGYRPDDVVSRLKAAGLGPTRTQDRVYFDDPDGIELQLSGKNDARPR